MAPEINEETTEKKILAATPGQTNCSQKNIKGKPCWGFLKIWTLAPAAMRKRIPVGDVIYRCQTCLTLYHGKPIYHVQKSWEGH